MFIGMYSEFAVLYWHVIDQDIMYIQ